MLLDVQKTIAGHAARGTAAGKNIKAGSKQEPKHVLESLKNSLFCAGAKKVLLTQMGDRLETYKAFEK